MTAAGILRALEITYNFFAPVCAACDPQGGTLLRSSYARYMPKGAREVGFPLPCEWQSARQCAHVRAGHFLHMPSSMSTRQRIFGARLGNLSSLSMGARSRVVQMYCFRMHMPGHMLSALDCCCVALADPRGSFCSFKSNLLQRLWVNILVNAKATCLLQGRIGLVNGGGCTGFYGKSALLATNTSV